VTDQQPYGPRYSRPEHPPPPAGKNHERAFEDKIRLGRDITVGAVLVLAAAAFTAAAAWYSMFVATSFWTPIPVALLAVALLLILVQVWYFVLREGPTPWVGAAIGVHIVLFAVPILVFIGVNEQVLTARGITEACTVVSQEKTYVRSGEGREVKYDHTLECPTGGELSQRTSPRNRFDVGESVVITYDPEGRAAHRTGEPSEAPLALFGGIAVAVFVVGMVARVIYLRFRVRRNARRQAAFGAPGL
jgi:4-amino-4-deoxy-L-arabinose transferase-like glycosyltransferase